MEKKTKEKVSTEKKPEKVKVSASSVNSEDRASDYGEYLAMKNKK